MDSPEMSHTTDNSGGIGTAVHGNGTAVHITDQERSDYLSSLQEETTLFMIPALAYLSLLGVIGVIGNSLVLIVYSRSFQRTSTNVFIMFLAGYDLLTNVVVIPGEIYDLLHFWELSSVLQCQIRRFFNAFSTFGSGFTLILLAVDRHRKVCKPFGQQISVRQSKFLSIINAGIAMLSSVPFALIFGRHTKKTPRDDIKGDQCSTDDNLVDTFWPFVHIVVYSFMFIISLILYIVLYSLIGAQARKHSRLHGVSYKPDTDQSPTGASTSSQEVQLVRPQEAEISCNSLSLVAAELTPPKDTSSFNCRQMTNDHSVQDLFGDSEAVDHVCPSNTSCSLAADTSTFQMSDDVSPEKRPTTSADAISQTSVKPVNGPDAAHEISPVPNEKSTFCSKTGQKPGTTQGSINKIQWMKKKFSSQTWKTPVITRTSESSRRHTRRVNSFLVLVTAVHNLCFLPYLGLMFFWFVFPTQYDNLSLSELSVFHLFLRFYLVNSAVNPIIYSLCHHNFRRSALIFLRKCCRKKISN